MKSIYAHLIDRCARLFVVAGLLAGLLGLPTNAPVVSAATTSDSQAPAESANSTPVAQESAPMFPSVSEAPALVATTVITTVSPVNMAPLGPEKVAAIDSTG